MLPYTGNPSAAMMLSSLYREELSAEAAHHHLVRTAKAQRRAERRTARILETATTRHWISGWPRRAGAISRTFSFHAS